MKKILIATAAILTLGSAQMTAQNFPYKNPTLPREERIEDLVKRLTLDEKIDMMMNASKGVERLGIPDYDWWNEALHGVARAGLATVFPQAVSMAATFDPETQLETFTIISDEARAKYNDSVKKDIRRKYYGLTFWTPNINIFRDPRWGRGQETYGEDPFLTTQMGVAVVRGLQGDNPDYYKTHACAKHFAVHSGPEWNRHSFDVTVSAKDLWETYLPAFKALAVDAGVREFMGAYNSYDGDPCCASDLLLKEILRGRWDYNGLVVSDCGAIDDFYVKSAHATHPDAATASASAVLTGTDIECGSSYNALRNAVKDGLVTEEDINVSIRRILNGMFELGMFDPEDMVPWSKLPFSIVDSEKHRAQALKVARNAVVLLKNEKRTLPIAPSSVKKIAVIGPNGNDDRMMLGNYNGIPSHTVNILEGIQAAYPDAEVTYERGCDIVAGHAFVDPRAVKGFNTEVFMGLSEEEEREARRIQDEEIANTKPMPAETYTDEALKALAARAGEADVIFFVGGLSAFVEGEEMPVEIDGFKGGDRTKIELPEIQGRVMKYLHATGKPVVFILCTGSAMGLEQNEGDYDALIWAGYAGQEGGTAVADIISGKVSPSGRLPITFYKNSTQLPDFQDYDMAGRTYRYMQQEPLYPFGFGLSYAQFKYGKGKLSAKSAKAGEGVTIKVKLSNRSKVDSDEVVQVYVKRLGDPEAPVKSLKGFQRVSLKAGEKKTVSIELAADAFAYYSEADDDLAVKKGKYVIMYGSSSSDKHLKKIKFTVK